MAGVPRRRAKVTFNRSNGVVTVAQPHDVTVFADTVSTQAVPHVLERAVAAQPDVVGINRVGFDHSWSIDGMTVSAVDLGYMLGLMLGDVAWATGSPPTQTVTPNSTGNGEYFNLHVDRVTNLSSTNPTENIEGCKIQSLVIDQQPRDFCKVNASGLGVEYGTTQSAISITIPTAADDLPLDYGHLSLTNGAFEFGESPAGQMDEAQSFKIEITREAEYGGVQVSTQQPTSIIEGTREITVEVTKEWDVSSLEEWGWFTEASGPVTMDFKATWDVNDGSGNYITIEVPAMEIIGSLLGDVGPGSETIKATFLCKARGATSTIMNCVVGETGSSAAWW